eukprot:572238-Prorocentrum_minimum.AAC.1
MATSSPSSAAAWRAHTPSAVRASVASAAAAAAPAASAASACVGGESTPVSLRTRPKMKKSLEGRENIPSLANIRWVEKTKHVFYDVLYVAYYTTYSYWPTLENTCRGPDQSREGKENIPASGGPTLCRVPPAPIPAAPAWASKQG